MQQCCLQGTSLNLFIPERTVGFLLESGAQYGRKLMLTLYKEKTFQRSTLTFGYFATCNLVFGTPRHSIPLLNTHIFPQGKPLQEVICQQRAYGILLLFLGEIIFKTESFQISRQKWCKQNKQVNHYGNGVQRVKEALFWC